MNIQHQLGKLDQTVFKKYYYSIAWSITQWLKKIESQKLKNTQWYVTENKDLKYKFK